MKILLRRVLPFPCYRIYFLVADGPHLQDDPHPNPPPEYQGRGIRGDSGSGFVSMFVFTTSIRATRRRREYFSHGRGGRPGPGPKRLRRRR